MHKKIWARVLCISLLAISVRAWANEEAVTLKKLIDHGVCECKDPIVIEGNYSGWKGACSESGQKTRSDWLLVQGQDCVYVSGKLPIGLSKTNPKHEKLRISGRLQENAKGQPYFKAIDTVILKN